jgi:hypothetical protein
MDHNMVLYMQKWWGISYSSFTSLFGNKGDILICFSLFGILWEMLNNMIRLLTY